LVAAVCCLVLSVSLQFLGLADQPLLDAEARYSSIGQQMFRSGDWVQPRLNTVRYYEKPPLLYWAIAFSHHLFGDGEFACRLPGALAYVGTVAVAFAIGLSLYGPWTATQVAAVTATSVGCYYFGRVVLPDAPLTFFLTLALLGLLRHTRRRASPWPLILFYAASACAGLTKGLVGLFVPFTTAAIYVLAVGGWQTVRQLRPGLGAVIVLGIFLPWHVALAVRDPLFVPFYVLNEHVYRFLNIREPIDYVPLSVPAFWAATAFWLLPWSLFLPAALMQAWRDRQRLAIPLIWSAVVVGFFSLARSRLEKYGLPAIPSLAVVVGAYWSTLDAQDRRTAAQVVPPLLVIVLSLLLAAVAFVLPADSNWLGALVSSLDGHYREHPEDVALLLPHATALAKPFSVLLALFGIAMLWSALTRRIRLTFFLWVGLSVTLLLFVDFAGRFLTPDRSMRAEASLIERNWEPGAQVVVAGEYEHAMSLGYYVSHPVAIVDGHSTDLAFGFRHGDAPQLVLSDVQLLAAWTSSRRVFLLADRTAVPAGATVLLQRPTHVLVTNRPLGWGPANDHANGGLGS
jgi:hypothetical protein